MKLVVDSNILIASMLKAGITRALLMDAPIEFLSPEHMLSEIRRHRTMIARRANLSEPEFDLLLSLVTTGIEVLPTEVYETKIPQAMELIGDRDPGDAPFLALALAADCGIWTYNAKHFEGTGVRVWSTSELADWVRSASAA